MRLVPDDARKTRSLACDRRRCAAVDDTDHLQQITLPQQAHQWQAQRTRSPLRQAEGKTQGFAIQALFR